MRGLKAKGTVGPHKLKFKIKMLTAVDPTEIQEEPVSLTKVLLTELPVCLL